jgi:hypothetical protein
VSATPITLQALVTPGEQPCISKAAALLADSLNAVGGDAAWSVEARFVDSPDQFDISDESIVVVSLLPEVDRDEEWAVTAQRLRDDFTKLVEAGALNLFVCTVLRHAGGADEPLSAVRARRTRIRRLNMLAIELSHELGLFVVDIDRDIAALGARSLETDYRLLGSYAPEAAGKALALSLLLVGLDAVVPVEVQTAARDQLALRPVPQVGVAGPRVRMSGGKAVAVKAGRRTQVIEAALDTQDESMVARFITQVLKGRLPMGEAFGLLVGTVRRHGVRTSATRLVGGMRKVVSGLAPSRR